VKKLKQWFDKGASGVSGDFEEGDDRLVSLLALERLGGYFCMPGNPGLTTVRLT